MNKSCLLYYNFLRINMLGSYLQRGMPNRICKYIVCEIIDGKKVTNISKNNYFLYCLHRL